MLLECRGTACRARRDDYQNEGACYQYVGAWRAKPEKIKLSILGVLMMRLGERPERPEARYGLEIAGTARVFRSVAKAEG